MPIPGVPAWIGDLDHLRPLGQAVLVAEPDGQIIFANTKARQLYRFLTEDLTRVMLADALLVPEDRSMFGEIADQVLAGTDWTGRLDVRRVDGTVRAAEVMCSPLRRAGTVVGLVCAVDDTVSEEGRERDARRMEDRLTRLARVAAQLGTAEDVETVTEVVISQAADAVGATVASLSLVADDDTLVLVGMRGGNYGADSRWSTYSRHGDNPAAEVVRTGRPLMLTGREAIYDRYPDLERVAEGPRSLLALPLTVSRKTFGVVTLSFPGRRQHDAAEMEFFSILADSCAQAVMRMRADEQAARQAARLRFLAEAATELSLSLDYERTLTRVARLAVPDFADWCVIDLVEDDRLHRLAVAHADPAKVQLVVDLEARYPSDRKGTWEVVRTARSRVVPEVTDEMLVQVAQNDEHLRLARELGLRSAVTVPLTARGRVLGVLSWAASRPGLRYDDDDVAFAEDFGRRCAIAIDNAQLYSQTLEAAARLQDAVLPDLDGGLTGWEVTPYYSPAGRTEVGGDFFDAIELADGRLAVFVGDVMGRGVAAAAAMAQIRASIRAYIAIDPTPEEVLGRLDQLFTSFGMTQLVTLVYLVADTKRDELTWVNAGHPPAIVLRADGRTEQLPIADGPPLGVAVGARAASCASFGAGDTVIAFTDGLIERRGEDIDTGQQRLLDQVRLLGSRSLHDQLPGLVDAVRDHTRDDDVAVLALRRDRSA
jgi:PAS domain S-box-containing protein